MVFWTCKNQQISNSSCNGDFWQYKISIYPALRHFPAPWFAITTALLQLSEYSRNSTVSQPLSNSVEHLQVSFVNIKSSPSGSVIETRKPCSPPELIALTAIKRGSESIEIAISFFHKVVGTVCSIPSTNSSLISSSAVALSVYPPDGARCWKHHGDLIDTISWNTFFEKLSNQL